MVADDVQMETPPVIRPPRRKKLLSLKGFKNLKTHLGLNLGTALVPEISFAAVPNHPKPVLSHSRIAKAVFSATWAGQSILCDALLQDGDVCSVKQETERKQTLKEIEDEISDPGYETIPVRSTIEEDVFEIANDNLSMGNDGENSYECHESSFETAADITELKTVTSSHKSVDHLYSVPNKRPIKVNHNLTSPQARSQIDVLETLKLMKAKQSESSFEIRKKSEIKRPLTWQSESNITLDRPSTETIQEFCKSKQPISASKRVEFMENLHMKLELLRKEVLDTVEENKSYQKQKLLCTKIKTRIVKIERCNKPS